MKEKAAPKPVVRPVNPAVDRVIGKQPKGAFNYGLYFNKWFYVQESGGKCPVEGNAEDPGDNLLPSIAMFNGEASPTGGKWERKTAGRLLEKRHERQEAAARSLESLGYRLLRFEAILETPLVVGLGNGHPSEKGFSFDWTLGVPYIPASGIKGVVRLAWLVKALNRIPEVQDARRFWQQVGKGRLPNEAGEARRVFGNLETSAEENLEPNRGGVVFMDAFPAKLPLLKAEIMNCHYPEYLNKANGRPTEDQSPNPQKYWAVDPFLDRQGSERTRFVFRILMGPELAKEKAVVSDFSEAFEAALDRHGLGAKTAVGHGRFGLHIAKRDDPGSHDEEAEPEAKSENPPVEPVHEIWKGVHLRYFPGSKEVSAEVAGKKAFMKGMDLIPEQYRAKLKKNKIVKVQQIEAMPAGGKNYAIVSVE